MNVFTPPNQVINDNQPKVFLGGTIDNGNSDDWQQDVIKSLEGFDISVYNPRRPVWEESWETKFESPQFFQQVSWELDCMDKADIIVINFLPSSKSPISLLELGLYASKEKVVVCCPDEFWRSGNVHFICNKFKIPLYKDFKGLQEDLKTTVWHWLFKKD